jgi:hypothetical protein
MNTVSTEKELKEVFAISPCNIFYPPIGIWLNCKAITYHPHSNECGPRSLLAVAVMMLHPNPTDDILMEDMSPNLVQITRTWVAATILSGQPIIPHISQMSPKPPAGRLSAPSYPHTLIPWSNNHNVILTSRHPTHAYPGSTICNMPSGATTEDAGTAAHTTIPAANIVNDSIRNNGPTASFSKPDPNLNGKWKIPIHFPSNQPKIMECTQQRNPPSSETWTTPAAKDPKVSFTNHLKITNLKNSQLKCKTSPKSLHHNKPITQHFITDFWQPPLPTGTPQCDPQPTWGHILDTIDTTTLLRVVLQNPNGLKLNNHPTELQICLQACHSIGTGIICLPETNSNRSKTNKYTGLKDTIKQIW